MKIVADEKIPLVREYFSNDELILLPGREIRPVDLKKADTLIVRSVTKVDAALLAQTSINYVGTVTSGFDHLDLAYLKKANITSFVAEGCNTTAVVEYVLAVCAVLPELNCLTKKKLRAGVIGAGKIGSRIIEKLQVLGFEVIVHDPFLKDETISSVPLADFYDLDLITLHTPLTKTGDHPTYHLIDKNFLSRQKNGAVLLNTSRGAVINTIDLKIDGTHLTWCFDVWENEPTIDLNVLAKCRIATPHIAGHTIQSKQRGIDMVYHHMCAAGIITPARDVPKFPHKELTIGHPISWQEWLLMVYNPLLQTQQMKQSLKNDDVKVAFDKMRNNFHDRDELAFIKLDQTVVSPPGLFSIED